MIETALMPADDTMYQALLERDASYEGIFIVGVKSTGIFCRPTCPARKPLRENVEFFPRVGDALAAGYRPCLRCQPVRPLGDYPDWLRELLAKIEADPLHRWTSVELRELGVDPARVRRWFQANHGMTFMAYLRSRRLGQAFSRIKAGDAVTETAMDAGFDSISGFCDALRKQTGSSPTQSRKQLPLKLLQIASPLGPLMAAGDDEAVYLLEFWDRRMLETQFSVLEKRLGATLFSGTNAPLEQLKAELEQYFAGKLRQFTTPLKYPGTEHQEKVWAKLLEVPHGETWTYGQLAKAVGNAAGVRAVARAVGENRLAILIPCHRIVGHDGQLTGYGGGLWRKRFLLNLECGRPELIPTNHG
ncbi:MAG: trifunctional transcriptional activator/DNA repair protein Ada/methylated-DNA--[protein]-cysteine S-methyltransferase [Verrucomicrobiota bacterium]|nr:trifunctional transcriptional activator/DNA repair protein Ada/methylated-DNA--[protein]-cysteine S-methyltransferase [Verrucomicrobiota bacterium]